MVEGRPSTMKPLSTNPSMNTAWSFQPGCERIGLLSSHPGPCTVRTVKYSTRQSTGRHVSIAR
jgi:hypothetical protein